MKLRLPYHIRGCLIDLASIAGAVALIVLILLIATSAAMPTTIPPNLTRAYRTTGMPQHAYHVFVKTENGKLIPPPKLPRPVVFGPLMGGGFLPGSGLPFAELQGGDDLVTRLYDRGFVIVAPGYTVDSPALPGQGRYGSQYQAEDDLALVHASLHHLVARIPDIDLGPPAIIGRSAGASVALNYVKRRHARWVFTFQTIATFAAYQGTVKLPHFNDSSGNPATFLGDAWPEDMHRQGALRHAEQAGFLAPVFCQAGGAVTWHGGLDWASFQGVFPQSNAHPPEHVLALQQALAGKRHGAESVFAVAPYDAALEEQVYRWICEREGIDYQ